jgi:hypothetical protein
MIGETWNLIFFCVDSRLMMIFNMIFGFLFFLNSF